MFYIFSTCFFAANGLENLLKCKSANVVILEENEKIRIEIKRVNRLYVYIHDDDYSLLNSIDFIAYIINTNKNKDLDIVIIASCSSMWLWDTLRRQSHNKHSLNKVKLISTKIPIFQLYQFIDEDFKNYPNLQQLNILDSDVCQQRIEGLNRSELLVLAKFLGGVKISQLSQILIKSPTTLHAQKKTGLMKMKKSNTVLHTGYPAFKDSDLYNLSSFEIEFIHAIYSRQLYALFQPVTDENRILYGCEILSRWNRKDKILLPGDFLPNIHSEYAWLLLTAFLLKEAVDMINKYDGRFLLTININTIVANHENFLEMMKAAKQKLKNDILAEKLVLEFEETIYLKKESKAVDNINNIQRLGFKIYLDDCYSESSAFFPARLIKFDGYKLDISIVNDLMHDVHALNLIKGLVYYCSISGAKCIAEGVDSLDKFKKLSSIGVLFFQGYLISPPLTHINLSRLFDL
ncbi:EAL domain-containing protein [Klebsiella quasipneumoniae]|uniref:EAL domain-containing protein n=1 Tax=Klebsiella quasipneumoniae TaxID=1463165 RepID=UPI00352A01F4